MGLDDALEYIVDDELVEVTPLSIRIRKVRTAWPLPLLTFACAGCLMPARAFVPILVAAAEMCVVFCQLC
jgi:hypothetical protein